MVIVCSLTIWVASSRDVHSNFFQVEWIIQVAYPTSNGSGFKKVLPPANQRGRKRKDLHSPGARDQRAHAA